MMKKEARAAAKTRLKEPIKPFGLMFDPPLGQPTRVPAPVAGTARQGGCPACLGGAARWAAAVTWLPPLSQVRLLRPWSCDRFGLMTISGRMSLPEMASPERSKAQ